MQEPLVIAYHLVWTAYGWWLPNDPRGSGSEIVRNSTLAKIGNLHYGRKTHQPPSREVRAFYDRAKPLLRHKLLRFTPQEIAAAARGLSNAITKHNYTCYACTIMPDHVHLVIRKHRHTAEAMIENLQTLSRERLVEEGLRGPAHQVWTVGGWKGFLDRPSAVRRVVAYVEKNPLEIGWPLQCWPLVTGYDDWPLHPGHSPNSPYARRLRGAR